MTVRIVLPEIEAAMAERLADLSDDTHLYVQLQDVPFPDGNIVTAIVVTVTVPSPVLGQRLMHSDLFNPMQPLGDDIYARSSLSIRNALAAQRQQILAKLA